MLGGLLFTLASVWRSRAPIDNRSVTISGSFGRLGCAGAMDFPGFAGNDCKNCKLR